MKITRLLASLLLLTSISARAQFAIIPLFGPNFGITHQQDFSNKELYSMGVKTGILGEYVFTHLLGVQTGALYSSYGIPPSLATKGVRAVEVPCMLLLRHCSKWSHNKIIFGIGPYLGLQLGANTMAAIDQYTPPAYIGLKASIGYELQNDLYFRFCLQPGLTNLSNIREAYLSQISLGVGYIIHFGSDPEDYVESAKEQ